MWLIAFVDILVNLLLECYPSKSHFSNVHHTMPKGPFVVFCNTHDINLNVGSFHVLTTKEVKNCKELAKVSSPNKKISSLRLQKSKTYVAVNLTIKKKLKLVEQDVGEENIGGCSDQDDTNDVTTNELQEQEEHEDER